jgi:DNA polymerase-3 subunit gamma/tau
MSRIQQLEALLGRIQTRRNEPRLVPVAAAPSSAPVVASVPAPAPTPPASVESVRPPLDLDDTLPTVPGGSAFPPEAPSEARRRSVPSPLELAVEVELDRPEPTAAGAPAPIEIDLRAPDAGPDIDIDTDEEEQDTPTVPPPAATSVTPAPRKSSISDLPPAALVDGSVPPPAPMPELAQPVALAEPTAPSGPVAIAAARMAPPSAPLVRTASAHAPAPTPATFGDLMTRTLALRLRNTSA